MADEISVAPLDQIRGFSDEAVWRDYETVTKAVASLIRYREDLAQVMEERPGHFKVNPKDLGGLGSLCREIALRLSIPLPALPDYPRRPRDESGFWMNLESLLAIVRVFLKACWVGGYVRCLTDLNAMEDDAAAMADFVLAVEAGKADGIAAQKFDETFPLLVEK